jgi:hypothetical protein
MHYRSRDVIPMVVCSLAFVSILDCIPAEVVPNTWHVTPIRPSGVESTQISAYVAIENGQLSFYTLRSLATGVGSRHREEKTQEIHGKHGMLTRHQYQAETATWLAKEIGVFGLVNGAPLLARPEGDGVVAAPGFAVLESGEHGTYVAYTLAPRGKSGMFDWVENWIIAVSHIPGRTPLPRYRKIHEIGGYAAYGLQQIASMTVVWGKSVGTDAWVVLSESGHVLSVLRPGEDDWKRSIPSILEMTQAFGRIKLVEDLTLGSLRDESGSGDVAGRQFWCVGAGEIVDSSATVLCLQEIEKGKREVAVLDVRFGDEVVSDVLLTEPVDQFFERFHVLVEEDQDPSVLEWFCIGPSESAKLLHLGKYVKGAGVSWTRAAFPADADPLTGYRDKDGGLHMFALTAKGELVELTLEEER